MAAVLASPAAATAAPRGCPQPLQDRHEPGDEVTLVGYLGECIDPVAASAAAEGRPLAGYLHPAPRPERDTAFRLPGALPPPDPASGIPLGRFTLEDTGHQPRGLRMTLSFRLPADVAPGIYHVHICQDPCTTSLTDGFRGWPTPLYVGVDPPPGSRPVRSWPLDDPAIAALADDALLLGPGGEETTAAQFRTAAAGDRRAAPGRTETGASTPAPEVDSGGDVGTGVWLVAGALLGLGLWVATRLGPARKRVRPGQGGG
jgi:hypothetical protein